MKKNMIIFAGFAIIIFYFQFINIYQDYHKSKHAEYLTVLEESKMLSNFVKAFRETYQKIFLENDIEINEKTINLLPAVSISKICRNFSPREKERITVNTVLKKTRNFKNRPDVEEIKIIDLFVKKKNDKDYYFEKTGKVYHYAEPIVIKKQCLKCHGKKEDVIPSIRKRYDTAYNYEEGEVGGIISIRMTKNQISGKIMNNFYKNAILTILSTLVFLTIIYFLIKYINRQRKCI